MDQTAMDDVDILILGAGVAGVMAAVCAAAYGLKTRIIDKRPVKITAGHADGLMPRTMEILASFGLDQEIIAQGSPLVQGHRWESDGKGNLHRSPGSAAHKSPPASPFGAVALAQARIQDIMYDYVCKHSNIRVERSVISEHLAIDAKTEYPVSIRTRQAVVTNGITNGVNDIRIDDDAEILHESRQVGGREETIRAKYVVACDGAHSWTRRQLGVNMLGDDTDVIWGVMDIVPITDFPTPRAGNLIITSGDGLMWIPRERGLVRVYCVLADAQTDESGRFIRSSVTEEMILDNISRNLRPYKLTYKYCEWWAAYQIGQRVATDNVDTSGRIFLAGDAVKTHSPKAGQGMNTAISDTYNLMWKLNLVLKGLATPKILQTYKEERLPLAQRQINFDRLITALASGREPPPTPEGLIPAEIELKQAGSAWMLLINGLDIVYPPSALTLSTPQVAKEVKLFTDEGKLPDGIVVGMRMPSFPVRRHDNSAIQSLGQAFQSAGGRFHFFIFAGDVALPENLQKLLRLSDHIEAIPSSTALVDSITILHTPDPLEIKLLDLPPCCRPFDPQMGWDYGKVFYDEDITDYQNGSVHIGSAYQKYGIDPTKGRVVLVRPDGYVACQSDFGENFALFSNYFEGIR